LARTHEAAVTPEVGDPVATPVDEPARPWRIRRPSDAIRFLVSAAVLGLVLLLPSIAKQTTSGLESDITHGTQQTPHFLLNLATLVSSFGVLAVPVVFAVVRLIRRDGIRIAVGLLAAVVALGATVGLDEWVTAPGGPTDSLSWGGVGADPLHTDITPVIAYVTAVRLAGRTRWQVITWTVIGVAALAALTAGYASVLALAATYVLGRAIGYGTLYAFGTPNPRPSGTAVMAVLSRLGLVPVSARRLPDGPAETRRYEVELADPEPAQNGPALSPPPRHRLDVMVLDRDQQSAGLLYRVWRYARLRGGTNRRALRSLRRSLEQESLMAHAAAAAGVRGGGPPAPATRL
jgi:hypothetical protein